MTDSRLAMLIDRVDNRGRRVGKIRRAQVFEARANFRVVHVLVFNRHGELLLQRVAESRERHPGLWGSSVAGYLLSGETFAVAAKRKVREELGVENLRLEYVGRTTMLDDGCKKFIGVYKATHDGPLAPNPNDFAAIWFMSFGDIARDVASGSMKTTPTFRHVLDFLRRHDAS
jgi:16S rRNA (adenine1518-N6/adenine1519-N6)-dimethyltransferase